MKKIFLHISILILIWTLSPAVSFAETEDPANAEDTQTRRELIDRCIESNTDENISRRQKRQACEEQYPLNSNSSQEVLPPIVKPTLLPGPTFEDPANRTGQDVTEYVTKKLLPKTASRLLTIITVASLLGFMFAGIQFYIAMGEPEKMQVAKRAAIFSVVGLIIAILSFSIVQIINLLPL